MTHSWFESYVWVCAKSKVILEAQFTKGVFMVQYAHSRHLWNYVIFIKYFEDTLQVWLWKLFWYEANTRKLFLNCQQTKESRAKLMTAQHSQHSQFSLQKSWFSSSWKVWFFLTETVVFLHWNCGFGSNINWQFIPQKLPLHQLLSWTNCLYRSYFWNMQQEMSRKRFIGHILSSFA